MYEIQLIQYLIVRSRAFAARFSDDERGVVDTVIMIAIFAGLALLVGGLIVQKVTAKAESIKLD
ncbi:MAG: hypothetical protein AB1679_00110 [Actinomycetota bacterium]